MNKGSIGGQHIARRKFQLIDGKKDTRSHAPELVRSVVDLINLHERGIISTAHATGERPAVVLEIYRSAMQEKVSDAYEKGFREGRLTPCRPLRQEAA